MSKINTLSVFYYGFVINSTNRFINFRENGGPEISVSLDVDDYTLEGFASAIAQKMTIGGTQEYSVSVDRQTRKLTISAVGQFDLLCFSGAQAGSSIWPLAGFINADQVGANSYESDEGAGFEYRPQLTLTDYLALEDNQVKESSAVNVSANGVVQTLEFGDGERMRCVIRGATNKVNLKITPFYENPNGLQDFRNFMKYLITKAKIEFMPDVGNRSVFYDLLLESSNTDRNGTRFEIENMRGANDFYQCGPLLFRKVIE